VIHLRDLEPGTRFMLMRTGEKFCLIKREFSLGKWRYYVFSQERDQLTTLHHSCGVKKLLQL
jgi:hypothetical protein